MYRLFVGVFVTIVLLGAGCAPARLDQSGEEPRPAPTPQASQAVEPPPQSPSRTYDPDRDLGGDIFHLQFTIPAGWEVEYVPSIEALNLFTLSGSGSARERSQIFIRYFDSSAFSTLRAVTIHSTEELVVGTGNYTARRYDIEKKSGVPPFPDQPSWRNERHIVTDFRDKTGFTRYYVVAARPDLDPSLYESILAGMTIVP